MQSRITNLDREYGYALRAVVVRAWDHSFYSGGYESRPRGGIIFYRLFPQRHDLDLADRELLRLLSMFSGPSLFNA